MRLATLLVFIALFFAPVAADAKKRMTAEEKEAFSDKVTVLYVDCLNRLKYMRAKNEELVRFGPYHPNFTKVENLFQDECMDRSARKLTVAGWPSIYHNLFTSFYARDYGLAKPPVMGAPVVVALDKEFVDPQALSGEFIATRHFGNCVIAVNPALAHGYLSTGVRDAANERYYAALRPAVEGCMKRVGLPPLSRNRLRGVIAEAMFKYRRAQGDAPVRRAEK